MFWTSLVAQMIKNLPAMQETWVQSLGWEDPLEKGMVTHSSIFAWKIPWTEESGQLQSTGSQRVGHNWVTNTQTPEPYMFRCYGLSQYIEQSRRWVWLMILVKQWGLIKRTSTTLLILNRAWRCFLLDMLFKSFFCLFVFDVDHF